MNRPPREKFALVIQDAGGAEDAPTIVRLRRFLKHAKRAYGLACVRIVEVQTEKQATQSPEGEAKP